MPSSRRGRRRRSRGIPERPHFKDYVAGIADDFVPLAGDRAFADDPAIIGGLARIDGRRVMLIGHEKGDDTASRLKHNFGMAKPEGYRKAIRLMQLADRFGLPVVTLVDTPGRLSRSPGRRARPGRGHRPLDRSNASRLRCRWSRSIVGEGGSGGAVAIATANRVLMFEHAVYSVISPEGCASILWRTADKAAEAAEAMKITAAGSAGARRGRPHRPRAAGRRASRSRRRDRRAEGRDHRGARRLRRSSAPNELRAQRRAKFLAIG